MLRLVIIISIIFFATDCWAKTLLLKQEREKQAVVSQETPTTLTLKQAIDHAIKNNHHAKESLASLPVAKAGLIIAKYFPNPIIGANAEIVKGGSLHPLEIGQTIELGRKRHYRIQIAKEQISKAELEVAILERDFGITRAQLKKAAWERLPSLHVAGRPTKPSIGTNIWGPYLGASFELPMFNRRQGEIAQAKANLDFLEKQKDRIEHDIRIEVANALKDLEVRERQVYRFQEGLLSQSEDILELIKEAYKRGKFTLTDVLNAEQKNRDLKQQYLNSLYDYQFALASLEYTAGIPLHGLAEKE